MVKEKITDAIRQALTNLGIENVSFSVEHPVDEKHGDYSANIALTAFTRVKGQGERGKNPKELAEIIASRFTLHALPFLDRVEVVPPGFLNFWLSNGYLIDQMGQIHKEKERYGTSGKLKNQKTMLEFADPNPFKEFHIGHLRNIVLGESYARLLEAQGATVWRVNYQGDVGMHVAKALCGMMKLQDTMPSKNMDIQEKVKFLGKAYAEGAKAYENNPEKKKEIQSINIKIYQKDESIKKLWDIGRAWSLEHFELIYKRVNTVYKHYYFESATAPFGREIVLQNLDRGIFERHEGAVIFRGEKVGLHTRVFVTKEDYATYEGKDLGLAKLKYDDFPYDLSIILTAHEQSAYFTVVLAAMREVFPDLAEKTIHHAFGFVTLREGKMSSRSGNVIGGEWLIDEAKSRIRSTFKDMDDETAEMVAVSAVKYSMLKFSRESDIQFSFDESISLEGNSSPYIQYTFARTQSVLGGKGKGERGKIASRLTVHALPLEKEEVQVLRAIARFPEIVEEAGDNFAPNTLCNYLFNLAQKFNLFYQKHQILPTNVIPNSFQDDNPYDFRLSLTFAVGQVLKNGLYLLGIQAPEKM